MSSPPAKRSRSDDTTGHDDITDTTLEDEKVVDRWSLRSWREMPIKQQPMYKDLGELEDALSTVRTLPPIVHPGEVDQLRSHLAEVANGNRFLLQGGDCAELFKYCNQQKIEDKLKILLQMSLVLTWGGRTPVVRIARMAGQYGKPRSSDTEIINGVEVPSYRGDNVNGFDPADREPDPQRLVQAYFRSATTLNYVRALVSGGFADLRQPEKWSMQHVTCAQTRKVYEEFMHRMLDSLDFMHTVDASKDDVLGACPFFSSHEALLLNYEEALTRKVGNRWYNLGAHFLWIGDRTRQLNGAHVEYFRGIANPIGVKVGPSMKSDELIALIKQLDPNREPGRITLITRFGASKVDQCLPPFIRAVVAEGFKPIWCCDPMHGNTKATASGVKTRFFDDITSELRKTFSIHKENNSCLNGVHFELTGEDVTECVGGFNQLSEDDLSKNYQSFCDPRLNQNQSLDIALLISMYRQNERKGMPTL